MTLKSIDMVKKLVRLKLKIGSIVFDNFTLPRTKNAKSHQADVLYCSHVPNSGGYFMPSVSYTFFKDLSRTALAGDNEWGHAKP